MCQFENMHILDFLDEKQCAEDWEEYCYSFAAVGFLSLFPLTQCEIFQES